MTTPNLGLSSTSQSSGSLVTFLDWRLLQDGSSGSSNMQKIDTWAGIVTGSMTEILEEKVHLIIGTGNGATYSANETDILSYFEGLTINLTLDTTNNTGATTLNINGLGNKFLKKLVAGVRTDVSAGDLGIGAYNLFVYSTGEFIWIGYESTTIHSNTSGEINGITGKTTPVDTDITIIEDSAFTYSKKKLTWANIKATLKDYFDTLYPMDSNVFHKNINGEILALTEKALPISEGSGLLMEDEAIGGGIKRKLSWAGIKSSLKSYFDAIYAGISKGVTNGDSHDHLGGDGGTIAHSSISGSGINTHTQIDTFINSKGIAGGLASLTSGSLVEQNPANATATPTASKIPIADANGFLNSWINPVAARYTTDAGQSIPNESMTIIDFGNQTFDTHGAVTTGSAWKYTCPTGQDGYHHIDFMLMFTSTAAWALGERAQANLYKGGVSYSTLIKYVSESTTTRNVTLVASDTIYLVSGEYIDIRVVQNSGSALALHNDGGYNHVSISKTG